MGRLFTRDEPRRLRAPTAQTDSVMQWWYRDSAPQQYERRAGGFVFAAHGNIVAAFDGERLLLARIRDGRAQEAA